MTFPTSKTLESGLAELASVFFLVEVDAVNVRFQRILVVELLGAAVALVPLQPLV